jgi:hypothetical protein
MNERWEIIKKIHSEKTGTPPHVVDYIAVFDILSKSVRGLSNITIAKLLKFDVGYVEEVLKTFLGYPGWCRNLEVSPLYCYELGFTSYTKFEILMKKDKTLSDEEIKLAYLTCMKYEIIKQEIEENEAERTS